MPDDLLGPRDDQLRSADPQDWSVDAGWQPLTDAFFGSAPGQALLDAAINAKAAA